MKTTKIAIPRNGLRANIPSPVCMGFHEPEIRGEFEETLRHDGARNTVMILKDAHTVENDPVRFARWVQIGREVFSRSHGSPKHKRARATRTPGERPC